MSAEMPPSIGRYQLQAELGRGGFGCVYRAWDPTVHRLVAIKILTEGDKDLLTRFRKEATVAGNLRHNNIVTVYEYGEYEGLPFLVMEYLEGDNLQRVLSTHRQLTLIEKIAIMSQVAEGLHCAHSNGVVHRDIKPANIMVLPDGTAKIMDFGIARLLAEHDVTRLTQEGFVVGTMRYMAPEQFGGGDVNALADIFAYGVIYYELLTGSHPFEAPDLQGLIYKVSFVEPAPIRRHLPECPKALERVVSRLLAKDRGLRYQSVKEVLYDSEPIRIGLRRAEAEKLLVYAQELFDKKDLDGARDAVLRILNLDPSNHVALALHENLQAQLHSRNLQPRIDQLVKNGNEHLSARRGFDAVQSFEAALRLDLDNVEIQDKLQQAQLLIEENKKSAELLNEAQREFEERRLTAAFKDVSEALRYDPQNADAGFLLGAIQDAMERRRQERAREEAIGKAEGLLLLHAYDEAISVLTPLKSAVGAEDLKVLLGKIHQQKVEHERRERLNTSKGVATELLGERRFSEAVECLEELISEFSDNEEIAHLDTSGRRREGGKSWADSFAAGNGD